MEPLPYPNSGPLPNATTTPLFSDHIQSTLIEFLRFSTIFLLFSIETIFIIQKWQPIFHFLTLFTSLTLFITLKHYLSTPPQVYLVDFSCLKPPNFCRVPFSTFTEHAQMLPFLDQESKSFMTKVLTSSGQGENTYLPPALHYIPPRSNQHEAIKEVHMVLFPVFEDLLSKTSLSPHDIDILIVNCSGFCPIPSLSSIIVNKYSMRENIKSYNIGGMGCSASALCIDMAQNQLKVCKKDSYAIVLSTEILSTGWYAGKERQMMVLNCLFRMGSAAILLTNKKSGKKSSKYKLVKSLRTQRAFDDKAYLSAIREEDSNGFTGVTLKRDLLLVAGETLRSNITILGGSILPYLEIFKYGFSVIIKKFVGGKSVEIYVPEFRRVVQHFCLPASGRPVIREVGKGLNLREREMEAALMTLHRFGNQSSSSLWYELSYMEGKERVKKGDNVWQLGMGSGPKCNSLVWACLRPIVGEAHTGPWADTIDMYPILPVDQFK